MVRSDFDKVNHLVLPYPRGFDNEYEKLTRFFEDLIGIIPNEVHQFIIVNNENSGELIKLMYPYKNIDTIVINGFNEIWLRDILGFPVDGSIVKPIFKPTYYSNVYTDEYLIELDHQTNEIIYELTRQPAINMPLAIDGGNLISNGEIGIVTEKVIRDNQNLTIDEITRYMTHFLKISPIYMKTSKSDYLGHSDGYAAFLDKKRLLVSDYPEKSFLMHDKACVEGLIDQLRVFGFEIIRVLDRPIDEKVTSIYNTKTDFLMSARGNYVNFLNLGNTVVLPQYDLITKKESAYFNFVNREIFDGVGVDIIPLNCNDISRLGGVLRCLSFVF